MEEINACRFFNDQEKAQQRTEESQHKNLLIGKFKKLEEFQVIFLSQVDSLSMLSDQLMIFRTCKMT